MNVILQYWEESEEGWGVRPDGVSIHLTLDDCGLFIKEYWDSMPDAVQYEYSRPIGWKHTIVPSKEEQKLAYDLLFSDSKYGVRYWQHQRPDWIKKL